jgi:hypothetical protein
MAVTAGEGTAAGPIILLSYGYSGGPRVQEALAADTSLACTSGTGVIPLCEGAAETWRRVEGHSGQAMSALAVSTIRGLITAQVTTILAGAGKARWCELATASPAVAGPFLQVFPHTAFVCVHRNCLDVIRAGVQASPWGLQGQGLASYLLPYPGNSVAALAAYWATCTEELLTFEAANSGITSRVRYEDVAADPDGALAGVRAGLGLGDGRAARTVVEQFGAPDQPAQPPPEVPVTLIPRPLCQRISRLHSELGYPPLAE